MGNSAIRIGRLLCAILVFSGLALHAATADAGYPVRFDTYPAPWVDGGTFDISTGIYACEDVSLGGAEACSNSYWPTQAPTGDSVSLTGPWTAASDPSNCGPYSDMYFGTDCYSGGWTGSLNGSPNWTHSTVIGQRCIYAAAPGNTLWDGGTLTGDAYQPGTCVFLSYPVQDAGCHGKCGDTTHPINTAVGNEHETFTDYRGQGPFPLTFTRGYNSLLANDNANSGIESIGIGWTTNVSNHLYVNAGGWPTYPCREAVYPYRYFSCLKEYSGTPALEITVWHADGGQALFTYPAATTPDGAALTPEPNSSGQLFFVATLPSPAVGSGYRYLRDDGYSEYYDSSGKLVSVMDKNGLQQVYSYTNGQLTSITDPAGRSLNFTYYISGTAAGLLETMTQEPSGYVFTYTYDAIGNLSTVTHPDKVVAGTVTYATVTYKYEDSHLTHALTGIVDENAKRYMTWGYDDSSGRATSSYLGSSSAPIDKFTVSYTVDTGGRVTTAAITEPTPHGAAASTRTVKFTTSTNVDQVTSSSAPCVECGDPAASRTYDANGYVQTETDFSTTDVFGNPVTNVTTYIHDATGLETSRTEGCKPASPTPDCTGPDVRTITTTWDATRQPKLITEPGRTTDHTYDAVGHLLTKTVTDTATGVVRTTKYTYNSFGLIETVTGPKGHVTRYDYDANGNLTAITKDPNGLHLTTQITSRDANGSPTTIIDPNGVVTTLTYDGLERLTSRTVDAGGGDLLANATTTYTYDSAGELKEVTLPGGSSLFYDYDDGHRLIDIYDNLPSPDKIVYLLDNLGNRYEEDTKDPAGNLQKTLSRAYNGLNQLTQVSTNGLVYDPVTQQDVAQTLTTGYTPDAAGNVIQVSDPAGNPHTTQGYDSFNRLNAIVDGQQPVNGNTGYEYDALGNVQYVTDPNGLRTHYIYDAFGDVTEQDSPDTGTTTYTYDLAGNRKTKTDARGVQAVYTYDALDRLTGITYAADPSRNVTYAYDQGTYGLGRLYSVTDASGTTTYGYDSHGNTTQKTVVINGHSFPPVGYHYDAADNLVQMDYPSGMHVYYNRDAAERVTSVTSDSATFISGIAYEPFGPVSALTYGNGLHESRFYDQSYQLHQILADGIQDLIFHYDKDGNVVGITDGLDSGNSQTLGYDTVNRLTSANGSYGSQSYQYDLDGNRIQENFGGTVTLFGYAYRLVNNPGGNQLLNAGAQDYQYDAMGNTIDDGAHSYNYDAAGRVTGYGLTGQSSMATDYLYNSLGQRATKFPVDDVAPTVSIVSPTGGVSGTVTVIASVADTFGVSGVQFKLDGVDLGAEVTTAPYQVSWNTSMTPIGGHTLTAVARDPGNNIATSAPITVQVLDVTPPTVVLTGPTGGVNLRGTVTLSAIASDNVGVVDVQFQLDGVDLGTPVTTAPYVYAWDTTTAAGGSHTLTAIASDAAGNTATSVGINVNVDNVAPTISLTAPAAGASLKGTVSVTANASDNGSVASVQIQLDGVSLGAPLTSAPYAYSWDTTTAGAGTHILTAVATDAAGNTTVSAAVTITVDNSAPSIAISAPTTGAYVRGSVTLTANASDNVGIVSVQYQRDGSDLGGPVTAEPFSYVWDTSTETNASHTLTAIASDAAGNSSTSAAVSVTVDNAAPAVAIKTPANGANVSGTTSLVASASDNATVAGVQFKLDGANLGSTVTSAPYSISWDTTTASGGTHSLTAVATDAAGNSTTSADVSVVVPDTHPPTVAITAPTDGAAIVAGDTVSVTATAHDDVHVTGVQFELDGSNLGNRDTTSPYAVSWTTPTFSLGDHVLTAVASDAAGHNTTSASVTITLFNVPTLMGPVAILHSGDNVNLRWTGALPSGTGYVYVLQSAPTTDFSSPTQIYSGTSTTFGTILGYTTSYRVRECKGSSPCGPWSNVKTVTSAGGAQP